MTSRSKFLSYPAAALAGSVLAVCSCTIVPLFAGIHRKGAGIGPAVTFLFFAPAANIQNSVAGDGCAVDGDGARRRLTNRCSPHVLVKDLKRWNAILADAPGMPHERYRIQHVTLQPEPAKQVIRLVAQSAANLRQFRTADLLAFIEDTINLFHTLRGRAWNGQIVQRWNATPGASVALGYSRVRASR